MYGCFFSYLTLGAYFCVEINKIINITKGCVHDKKRYIIGIYVIFFDAWVDKICL